MAFCRLVFPILVISVASSYAATQVPVFLWGDLTTSIKSNPLSKIPQMDFEAVLRKELKQDPFTVIFVDETLSVEDFSRKNSEGDTSFPYLHANIGKAVYLPAVEDPLPVLKDLADPEKVDHVKLTEDGLSAEFEPESVKILFITLKDAREGESRAELLRRHNDFMQEMFDKLQKQYDNVIAIYTAENPSWTILESHSRVRRQATNRDGNYALNGLKLYVSKLYLIISKQTTTLDNLSNSSSVINSGNMSTTMIFGENTLTLNFMESAGYWFFSSVVLNDSITLSPTSEVYALSDWSYRCGQNVTFSQGTTSLVFIDLKVQPYFTDTSSATVEFGESVNCIGFFSVPIWSGLFVVFILLSIMFYGVMMMMDIRTMDRFDDPKGKTITINTAE